MVAGGGPTGVEYAAGAFERRRLGNISIHSLRARMQSWMTFYARYHSTWLPRPGITLIEIY